jgi:hypothetical protein
VIKAKDKAPEPKAASQPAKKDQKAVMDIKVPTKEPGT